MSDVYQRVVLRVYLLFRNDTLSLISCSNDIVNFYLREARYIGDNTYRSLVLTGHSMYPNYKGYLYNLYMPMDNLLDRLISNEYGSIELKDNELNNFLGQYKCTSFSQLLMDDHDMPFNHDLKLAILNSH